MPGHRHCRVSPPILGQNPFHRWWRSSLFGKLTDQETCCFLVLLPQVTACRVLLSQCWLVSHGWKGTFHSWGFRVSLPVVFSAGWFSPMREPWGPGFLVSLALAIASYCLRHLQGGQLPLSLCCFTPLPGLVLLKPLPSGVLTVSSALDSERRTPLGCSSCSVSFLPPLLLLPWWLVGAAARGLASHFFPLPFPWSLRYSVVSGWGAGMGLPYRVVPFFSYRVACLRSSGGGH